MLPTKAKQDALVHGYMKEQSKISSIYIPLCINQLCLKFYNEIFYVKFKGDRLKEFLSTESGESWETNVIEINGVNFIFSIFPNGVRKAYRGEVTLCVQGKAISHDIHRVVCRINICCQELKRHYITTVILNQSPRTQDVAHYGHDILSLSECQDKNNLTFSFRIEVLSISYQHHTFKRMTDFGKNIKMKRKIELNWNWTNDGNFENNQSNKRFGPVFDDNNWILTGKRMVGGLIYHVRLGILALPLHVSRVVVKLNVNNKKWNKKHFRLYTFSFRDDTHTIIWEARSYDIKINLEIVEIYDTNCIKVNTDKWQQYGILLDE